MNQNKIIIIAKVDYYGIKVEYVYDPVWDGPIENYINSPNCEVIYTNELK